MAWETLKQSPAKIITVVVTAKGVLCGVFSALGVQQSSLLGASPSLYSQQSALAAASLNTQTAANYQITQQTAALQQQAAAAAAAALQQVSPSSLDFRIQYCSCRA